MSEAVSSQDVVLQRDTLYESSEETYSDISEVIDVSGPQLARQTIDCTHLSSTNGVAEFVSGLRNSGTLTFTMNYTVAEYDLLKADYLRNTLTGYRLYIPLTVPYGITFDGLLTSLNGPSSKVNDKITMTASIQISGDITHAVIV